MGRSDLILLPISSEVLHDAGEEEVERRANDL